MATIQSDTSVGSSANRSESAVISSDYKFSYLESIAFGRSVQSVLPIELKRLHRRGVFVVSTRSLASSPLLEKVLASVDDRLAGVFTGVSAHAPRRSVIEGAAAARTAGADLLLAVGGGSVIDAAKGMLLALRHGHTDASELDDHANAPLDVASVGLRERAHWLPLIAVPTTFSAAEYTPFAGITEPAKKLKQVFSSPMMIPSVVVNDPDMIRSTPISLLLSTGMKAVDHAVERVTSIRTTPYSDAVSLLAIRMLSRGLRLLAEGENSMAARSDLQYGVWMAMAGGAESIYPNLSHAIGHVLGPLCDVPHGETSGVLLPSVLRWIGAAIGERRRMICDALSYSGDDPAEAVALLVKTLRLPARLRDVGVSKTDLDRIADYTLRDPLTVFCSREVKTASQVREVLDLAW